MRLTKVLCIAALVAMSAAVANAGSILGSSNSASDPKLVINKPTGGTGLGRASAMSPIVIDFNASNLSFLDPVIFPYSPGQKIDLVYDGTSPLVITTANPLFIGIASGIPFGTMFACGGTAFSACDKGEILNCGGTGTPVACEEGFSFGGFTGPMMELLPGETLSATLEPLVNTTPEPGTVLMFLSLIPALGFAAKRWNARQTA
jgi:hypothetical protein